MDEAQLEFPESLEVSKRPTSRPTLVLTALYKLSFIIMIIITVNILLFRGRYVAARRLISSGAWSARLISSGAWSARLMRPM